MADPLEAPALPAPPPEPSPAPLARLGASERPHGPVSPRVLPTFPTAAEARGGLNLSRGAAALHDELHALALHRARALGLEAVPSSLVVFCPAVLVYALTGYSESHGDRLARELRASGALEFRGWVAEVGKVRRYAGTLWALRLRPTAPPPRLRWWDFREDWRPDFGEDYHGEQGAFRIVQDTVREPFTPEDRDGRLREVARAFAVGSYRAKSPVAGVPSFGVASTLRGVADGLPGLLGLHPRQLHKEVGRAACDIAHALNEPERFKQWTREVYRALRAENEMRPGLSVLREALLRLEADIREAPGVWRRPGAVLASRLRASA